MSDEAIETTNEETSEEAEEAAEELPCMKPREFAGAINAAKAVFVWVDFGQTEDGDVVGMYLQVKKENARALVEEARENECDVVAEWEDGKRAGNLLVGIEPDDEGEEEEGGEEETEETPAED